MKIYDVCFRKFPHTTSDIKTKTEAQRYTIAEKETGMDRDRNEQ